MCVENLHRTVTCDITYLHKTLLKHYHSQALVQSMDGLGVMYPLGSFNRRAVYCGISLTSLSNFVHQLKKKKKKFLMVDITNNWGKKKQQKQKVLLVVRKIHILH